MNHEQSRALYDRALSVLSGGVNSSVRATRPYPFIDETGDGGHVIDADGNRYIDFVMGYGPLLYGHDMPEPVRAAVQSHASEGPMYGAPTEVEVKHAEFVARHVPSVEMIRFVNSGTEATVSAVRLARGYTGRDKIVVMQSGYHGAQESTLVEGEPGDVHPSTRGIPESSPNTRFRAVQRLRSRPRRVRGTRRRHRGRPHRTHPRELRHRPPGRGLPRHAPQLTDDHGALLVFDEVITGFRVGGLQCAQGKFGITPDVTTFGKIIGGGFPVGAIGGKSEIIEQFTPSGNVFQSGTFSGHPVTIAAGWRRCGMRPNTTYTATSTTSVNDSEPACRTSSKTKLPSNRRGRDSMFKVIFTLMVRIRLEGQCEAGCQNRSPVRASSTVRRPATSDTGRDRAVLDMEPRRKTDSSRRTSRVTVHL